MTWKDKIERALTEKRSLLCVGLDTDLERLGLGDRAGDMAKVNKEIVLSTHEFAAAYKLNMAFYEASGIEGWKGLIDTIALIKDTCPEVMVVLDGKRGDIGNTSKAYARSAFGLLGADAVTLNGYMGKDAIEPFASWEDRLSYVLCRTSNPSSVEVQDMMSEGDKVHLHMARLIKKWNVKGNLGAVVGATYPEELASIRSILGPKIPLLIPGVGSQGGDLVKVLEHGTDDSGAGVLINVSRDIMFAFEKRGWDRTRMGEAAGAAASDYRSRIEQALVGSGRW